MSRNGVYLGLSLPERMRATRVASRPSVWSSASMTNHLRAISPLGKYVDISKLSQYLKKDRERAARFRRWTRTHLQAGKRRTAKELRIDHRGLHVNETVVRGRV